MAKQLKIEPYRALLIDIANNVRKEEIKELLELSKIHITHERLSRIEKYDIQGLLIALEDSGALANGNFSFIVTCLKRINRVDLAGKVEQFMEAKRKEKLRVIYWRCGIFGPVFILFGSWLLSQMYSSTLFINRYNYLLDEDFLKNLRDQMGELKDILTRIESLHYKDWSIWTISLVSILLICLLTWLYQCYKPCSFYRMKKCQEGCIPGHVMTFTFVTFDMQLPLVRGLEFEWDVLVKKLNLTFSPHPNPDVHYYLNYDRCGAGGVRHVASWLDSLPMIRGAEIFAVNEEATKVWYNLDNSWHEYASARDIRCSHHGNYCDLNF